MRKRLIAIMVCVFPACFLSHAQDLSEGLIVNDLSLHPMQEIAKPAYLNSIIDPSFGTTIRRISNAGAGEVIVPMYSTIQAWNASESLMILYNQSTGYHELLNGMTYEFIRVLDDVIPADLEQIFWDFNDSDIFYYLESESNNFIRYTVSSQAKTTMVNLGDITTCSQNLEMGNDIQMMSWDSDVFTFRCENNTGYSYRLSTSELTSFSITDIDNTAPSAAPSGNRFYHGNQTYDSSGNSSLGLNESSIEHSCMGILSNGNDAHFAIAFAEGPMGGCIGDIIAHDLTNGECFPIISQTQGYDYPQSGTHISALAHKNTEGGWIVASMIGYDEDGQELLDQELVIAKAEQGNIKVCRIGHHRSDENQFDYWGEPHAVISPTGTRVLFGSDWSGSEDGQSVDSYVVELPTFPGPLSINEINQSSNFLSVFPNPIKENTQIRIDNPNKQKMTIKLYDAMGREITSSMFATDLYQIDPKKLISGMYYFSITNQKGYSVEGKFVKN